jgi:O-antigen ligase
VGANEVLLILVVLALALGPPLLAYRDMKRRGRSDLGLVIVLAMVFAWPVGFVLWFVWRDRYPRVIDLPRRLPSPY